MINSILIVCIGNICRSPMADALFRRELPDVTVRSAGLDALVGHPADATAIEIMAEAGLEISQHRAHSLTSVTASRSDLILVMDNEQKHEIQRRYMATSGKVFRLGETEGLDIPDPYRQPRRAFERTLGLIHKGVDAWVPRIQALG